MADVMERLEESQPVWPLFAMAVVIGIANVIWT